MLRISCDYVRNELSAYHDEELTIPVRIAIAEHLADCPSCSVEAEDLRAMREALREGGAMHGSWLPSLAGFESEIVGRLEMETYESLASRARRLIDDPVYVWATGAAFMAGTACLLLTALFGSEFIAHPASLAALLNSRTHDVEILPASPLVLPRVNAAAVMPATTMSQRDGEAAFVALVTADGSLADLEILTGLQARDPQTDLLAAVATARFEPARVDGAPVALNVVWLITHQTVRGSMPPVRIPGKPHVRKTV